MKKLLLGAIALFICACSSGGGGATGQDATPTDDSGTDTPVGCVSASDCDDGFNCTIDSCYAGKCSHTIGPMAGSTACAPGEYCTLSKGCVKGKACAKNADCTSDDPCTTGGNCDPASSVCLFKALDKDGDGHPPPVCGGDDCDDSDPSRYPGAPELCDGKDNNCDGIVDNGATCSDSKQECKAGSCACKAENLCGTDCVDKTSDPKNCGTCGKVCATGWICSSGACTCPTGSCGTVEQLALGSAHTCALKTDGTVLCWGQNIYGQLGDGTTTDRLSPKIVPGLSSVTSIALSDSYGTSHACALKTDGTVLCWGSNMNGQLGDGTTTDRLSPTAVPGLSSVTQISLGDAHTCARKSDGTALCWGGNSFGQLGDGTGTNRLAPTTVPGLSGVAEVSLGDAYTCARKSDGTALCWGSNMNGQLGDGTTTSNRMPTTVSGLSGVAQISLSAHTCAVKTSGAVFCWGLNLSAQLGDGTTSNRASPTSVAGLLAVSISLGGSHTCARKSDGTALCWGSDASDQLGYSAMGTCTLLTGTTFPCSSTPTAVPGLSGTVEISLGGSHTCARKTDGTILCWGRNSSGQLGDGTTTNRSTPTTVKW